MEKVAYLLRQAREHRGMTLEEAAQKTRIALHYLIVLEEPTIEGKGRTRFLADPLYLIPHLRAYAAFLDLDPNFAVTQFTNELQNAQEKSDKIAAAEQSSRLLRSSAHRSRAISVSIVLASVLITLAFIGQYSDMNARPPGLGESHAPSPSDSSAAAKPRSPALSPPASIPASPASSRYDFPNSSSSSASPQTPPAPTNAMGERPSSPTPSSGGSASLTTTPSQPGESGESAPPSGALTPLAGTLVQQPIGGSSHVLRLQAKEATWIRIVVEGQPPKELILRPGQSATWSSDTIFQLTLGNAGGVAANLDGQDLPPLGKSGQVIRNLRLPAAPTETQG